jgi:hypothetical protein
MLNDDHALIVLYHYETSIQLNAQEIYGGR